MKKYFLLFFCINVIFCNAQKILHDYRFKILDKVSVISKVKIDSSIKVLKLRLLNLGYETPIITYDGLKKEFVFKSYNNVEDIFFTNWLLKPFRTFFYETYTVLDLANGLLSGASYNKDKNLKKAFFVMLNTNDSILNNRKIPYTGVIKISDTSKFNKIQKALRRYLPADCIFAYLQNKNLVEGSTLEVYSLKNNEEKLPLYTMIDSVKTYLNYRGDSTIFIHFNNIGTKKFARLTMKNTQRSIALVIDGLVCTAPFVYGPIESGKAEIAGVFTKNEVGKVVKMISAGYLPLNLSLIK